ncbi:MAG: gliding motility-associated C-terminal domain-containing protein [Flavobacteriales bacterium]|nr:gliding motility-associated C-terminal domain-containing protein [Flavobacteriales bacterium]
MKDLKQTLTISILFLLLIYSKAQTPLVYNQGDVFIDNALIHVNGDWENRHTDSHLTNNGTIYLKADDNEGDFSILDSANVSGNGIYRIENDWTNSGNFISDSSQVYLYGDNELITGDSVSRFFDLILEGTGVKTQTIDAETKHWLNLNNLELATMSNEMFVSNSWLLAISNQTNYLNEGMVSSDIGGLLTRKTDSVGTYLFPVGSKINGHQYRPITIENLALNNETAGVRMIPNDATIDGFDRSLRENEICLINPAYYHQIVNLSNLDPSNVTIYFDGTIEPQWNMATQWAAPTPNLWNLLVSNPIIFGNYTGRKVDNHNNYSTDRYALGYYNSFTPIIYGDTMICDTSSTYLYATNEYDQYNWSAYNNGNVIGNSFNQTLSNQWYNVGTNFITLTVIDSLGCVSPEANINILVNHLSANYDTTVGIGLGNVNFINSSLGATSFDWSISDYQSSDTDVNYTFLNVGEYPIQLIAYNDFGCSDTLNDIFIVPALFWVPNVFTPNGVIGNETFFVDAIGVKEYRLQIFDRWGLLMFESTNDQWDGTNQFNGLEVPEATYFFIYEAIDIFDEPHTFTGPLSLFR